MPGPVDYGQMIGGLLGLMQPVGDVIPFQRRNPDLKMQTEMGARPYSGGGPHYPMRPAKPGEPLLPNRTPKPSYELAQASQRYMKKHNIRPEEMRELLSLHGWDILRGFY